MEFGDEPLDFQIPDVVEPIVGYRSWLAERRSSHPSSLRLTSSFGRDSWEPGEAKVAQCGNYRIFKEDRATRGISCSESPSRSKLGHHGFGCGIYAYKDPCRAAAYHDPARFGSSVWGEILMWGNVYEHEHGFRAQFAIPSAIACMRGYEFSEVAISLTKIYEVGLIPDTREIAEGGRWNPITRTLESTMTETDYLLDRSVRWPHGLHR